MRAVVVFVVALVTAAYGLVTGFKVDPVKAVWSGKADPEDGVGQVMTINFDELDSTTGSYVEFFAGSRSGAGAYHLSVLTYTGGSPIAYTADADGDVDHEWVRFHLQVTRPESIVKGKKLEFRFTRSGSDSLHYYYDSACGYGPYGQMIAPYPPLITPSYGLAMRCLGRMRPVDSSYWAAEPMLPDPGFPSEREIWKMMADSAGLGAVRFELRWDWVQPGSLAVFDYSRVDSDLSFLTDSVGCRVFCLLNYCAPAASSREDTTLTDSVYASINCAPRGLYYPIDSPSNYWARFVNRTVRHLDSTGHSIHAYEVLNETNDTCVVESLHGYPNWVTGWWRRPNLDYGTGFGGLRGLCSLYVRLCQVAESVIHHSGLVEHEGDTILIGALARVTDSNDTLGLVAGKTWLRTCYDIAGENVFWSGVSFHPYQGSREFDADYYQQNCDTVRTIMREHGQLGPVWNTEIGWDTTKGESANARNLCKTFVSSKASELLPQGGYDRVCWWLFREEGACGYIPLLDDPMEDPYHSFYAFRQMTQVLTDKRLNGRVMLGGTKDDSVRVYEFEDTTALKRRTWVCWQNAPAFDPPPTVAVKLPARSDTAHTVGLDYTGVPPSSEPPALASGWLPCTLTTRPAFITEPANESIRRPDLVVDSVRQVLRVPDTVLAWVTNRGSRATPRQSPGSVPYPTWAVLYANGDSLAQQVCTDSIGVNQQVTFRFSPAYARPVAALLAVKVNPGQSYVELGTDDNNGYRLKVQP